MVDEILYAVTCYR